ncbi:MAG: heme-binding protein [Chloroflexi bacterium]|nr:heme-binding protein [Chloroflexota bacterium]
MPDLNFQSARAIVDGAIAHAQRNDWRISVCVLDAGGNLLQAARMDGCNFLSPDIARGKAFGAAAWKQPSSELGRRFGQAVNAAAGMVGISANRMVPVQGALPIWSGGACLGAAGASGVRSDQDEECVRAGLQAAGFSDQPES